MKIKIIIDSYQEDMFKVVNNQVTQQVASSKLGRILMNEVINHPQKGLDTKDHELSVGFFIREVPRMINEDTYVKPGIQIQMQFLQFMIIVLKVM